MRALRIVKMFGPLVAILRGVVEAVRSAAWVSAQGSPLGAPLYKYGIHRGMYIYIYIYFHVLPLIFMVLYLVCRFNVVLVGLKFSLRSGFNIVVC